MHDLNQPDSGAAGMAARTAAGMFLQVAYSGATSTPEPEHVWETLTVRTEIKSCEKVDAPVSGLGLTHHDSSRSNQCGRSSPQLLNNLVKNGLRVSAVESPGEYAPSPMWWYNRHFP